MYEIDSPVSALSNLMADTYKVATLNVNGVSATIRMRMLVEFLHIQEIDIIILQEVPIMILTQ